MRNVADLSAARDLRAMRESAAVGDQRGFYDLLYRLAASKKYRRASVPIAVTINTSTSGGTANAKYRVPADEVAFLTGVRGYLGMNAMTSESLGIAGIGNPSVADRVTMKGQNARIDFINDDTKRALFENSTSVVLADILAQAGGRELTYDPPDVILPGETVKMTVTLKDTTAAIVGGGTDYGLVLELTYIAVK